LKGDIALNVQLPEGVTERIELWFQQEMPRLYRYLCYQTCDKSSAEEITSSVCEKAISKIAQYDPSRGDLRIWMFGIARNELRMHYRSIQRQPGMVSIENLPDFIIQAGSLEEEYQKKETFLQVLQVIKTLSEREQEVIGLRYGAMLPVKEIAVILGMNENQVSVLIHRTLEKLKTIQMEVLNESLL
jgi:RNA polymerase sigma factor (sigma-70 family)